MVRRVDLQDPRAQALVAELNADLTGRYPPGTVHFFALAPEETAPGVGAFVVAMDGDDWCGCGAVRRLPDGRGEIKRMYVRPTHRGHGAGRAVLAALIAEADALGCPEVCLETGDELTEAMGLYTAFGFERVPCWGEYAANEPDSVCLARPTRGAPPTTATGR